MYSQPSLLLCNAYVNHIPLNLWSGGRDLNPQPSPWKSETLPLSYPRPLVIFTANFSSAATI